jgi:lipopolysaccharide export LptBFGC system permease protein LptF
MLFRHFLKSFFIYFISVCVGIIPVFASCDMLVRLIAIPISLQVLSFFLFIIPLVALFAIPIASIASVSLSVGKLFVADEILSFFFWKGARRSLVLAVASFALLTGIIFVPLVFDWAPRSYWRGKSSVVELAKTHVENLEPGRFHTVGNAAMFFFRGKEKKSDNTVYFKNVLCSFIKDKKRFFISAEKGTFSQGEVVFLHGSLIHEDGSQKYVTTFQKMFIAVERLVGSSNDLIHKTPKFMGLSELLQKKETNDSVWKEFHRRSIQSVWLFLFPFFALFSIILFARKKSNLLLSIVITGLLFLFSYISTNITVSLIQRSFVSIVLLYALPLCMLLPFGIGYLKKW